MHRKSGRVLQHGAELAQQRSAAGHGDALVDDVGGDFRLGVLERRADYFDDAVDGLDQGLGDLRLGEGDFARHALADVAPADVGDEALAVRRRARGADLELDALGGGFADQEVEVAPDVSADRLVHAVAADAGGAAISESLERDHADLGRAAADIDDHRPDRLGHRQACADRRRHRFLDQRDAVGAGIGHRVADRAPLDRGRARGDADHDFGAAAKAAGAAVRLADEVLDHLLGDFEVGDDAAAQRSDGLDVLGRLAHHQLGVVADGADAADAVGGLHRYHRRLAGDDAGAMDVDHGVRGAEVDRDAARREVEQAGKRQERDFRCRKDEDESFPTPTLPRRTAFVPLVP